MGDRAQRATNEQRTEIGEIICTFGSCEAQYGYYGDGWVYLHLRKRKVNHSASFYISPDGETHKDAPFAPGERLVDKSA